ncbi:MAG TPA: MarR family winged helix-turn-helix transcriptional regulator [Planctomycetota bacterium]|nr:MarR family winged helix-turn-helix transcriptional regulator [Planctomycetota bacterium]
MNDDVRPSALARFERASGSLDERLSAALAKVALAARHDLRRAAARDGLSAVQAQILAALSREGALEIGALASRLGLTQPTVSDSVAALEARRLVRRRPDPADRRRVRVEASAAGRRLGGRLVLWPELFREGLEGLSEADKEILFRTMQNVIVSLLDRGAIQEARICRTCAWFRPNVRRDPRRPHLCALVGLPLGPATLRVDCPDHRPAAAPPRGGRA